MFQRHKTEKKYKILAAIEPEEQSYKDEKYEEEELDEEENWGRRTGFSRRNEWFVGGWMFTMSHRGMETSKFSWKR